MRVTVTGRRIEVTEAIRNHIDEGLQKVRTHFGKVIDVDAILSVEKGRQIAEFNLHANGLRINAKETSRDLYTSIDAALLKIDRQVRKHKERILRHQPRTAREMRSYNHRIIELTRDAEGNGKGGEQQVNHRVVHRETIDLKPMTIDEAALQLDLVEDEFFVFSNVETSQLNVIYAHVDGTYGLIEP